jgi:hypothetical protein
VFFRQHLPAIGTAVRNIFQEHCVKKILPAKYKINLFHFTAFLDNRKRPFKSERSARDNFQSEFSVVHFVAKVLRLVLRTQSRSESATATGAKH